MSKIVRKPVLISHPPTAAADSALRVMSSMSAADLNLFRGECVLFDFECECGTVLPEIRIAFISYGRLAPDGRNAVLVNHTIGNHHYTPLGTLEFEGQPFNHIIDVEPRSFIDVREHFVVCSNVLGGAYGSTNAKSIDPATQKPYGSKFPPITMVDVVNAQRRLLDVLGVTSLKTVVGMSLGGHYAWQLGVSYPDYVRGIFAYSCWYKPREHSVAKVQNAIDRLAQSPHWHGGDYYANPQPIQNILAEFRFEQLKGYALDYGFMIRKNPKYRDTSILDADLRAMSAQFASVFDPNSYLILLKSVYHNLEHQLSQLKCKIYYGLVDSDLEYPPTVAQDAIARIQQSSAAMEFQLVNSELGHISFVFESEKWGPRLRRFLEELDE